MSLLAQCNDSGNHQQESNIRVQVIFFRIIGENHQQESRIRVQVISFGRLSATRVVALESRGTISVESVFCCVDCRVHILFPYFTFQTVKIIAILQRSTQQNKVSLSILICFRGCVLLCKICMFLARRVLQFGLLNACVLCFQCFKRYPRLSCSLPLHIIFNAIQSLY